jgi:hypothetical protein
VLRDALERFGGLEQPSATIAARARCSERGEVLAEESADATGGAPASASTSTTTAGRPVRRAQPPGHRGGRAAARDGRDRPRRAQLSAPAGRVDLVQPADGRVRIVPRPRARAGRAGSGRRGAGPRRGAQRPRAEDAAAREIVTEEVDGRSFRSTPAGSGRCTASPRTP